MPVSTKPSVRSAASRGGADTAVAVRDLLWARPGFLVRRLNQIHYAMFHEECQAQNITPVQYGVLSALTVMPGPDQTALGNELGIDRTTTADVIARLETRRLVARRPNPLDRRTRRVYLTATGRRLVAGLHDAMARAQQRLLEPLPPAQRDLFMQMLSTLVEANNQYSRAAIRPL